MPVNSTPTNLFHPLLFEPSYWQERLAKLSGRARRMMIVPRPDLGHGGLEVVELLLRSHDDVRLRGIVAFWPIAGPPRRVRLHWPLQTDASELDLDSVTVEAADLYLYRDPDRRLEDRVLDFLCLICGAKGMPGVRGTVPTICLAAGQETPDEYRIGKALLERGWCSSIEVEEGP